MRAAFFGWHHEKMNYSVTVNDIALKICDIICHALNYICTKFYVSRLKMKVSVQF